MPFDFDGGTDDGGTINVTRRLPGAPDESFAIPSGMTVEQFKREYNLDSYTIRISGNSVDGNVRMSEGDVLMCTAPMKAGV